MRTLTATLQAAQEARSRKQAIKVVFTHGATTYTYEYERMLFCDHSEGDNSHSAVIELQNADHALDDIALKGYKAVISHGFITPAGKEVSAAAPLTVIDQRDSSAPGLLRHTLQCLGIPDDLKEDKANADYQHHKSSLKTPKALITEIMDGQPVAEELTEAQETVDGYENLYAGALIGSGFRATITNTVTKLAFKLKKYGSPTGNVQYRIRDEEGVGDLALVTVCDASALTTTATWYEITFAAPLEMDAEINAFVQFGGGDEDNYVMVAKNAGAYKEGEQYVTINAAGEPYNIYSDEGSVYRYKYQYAGISVFDHCESVGVEFDSEDSLIDTYLPQDAFRINEGEDRLTVIERLLFYTACYRNFKADAKMHVFVPVTSGTTYDSEYSLASGHPFFNKSHRDALVIPNKIIVRSPKDSAIIYEGSATSAASYALKPKNEYKRMALESNAQGNSIAAAIIGRLEVNAQQGGASAPVNCGSELYDYIKVTDARQGDTRTGNLGTIRRVYRNYPDKAPEYNMYFSFGRMTLQGVPGTRASSIMRALGMTGLRRAGDNGAIPWDELYALLDDMTGNLRDINMALGWLEGETPADKLIGEAVQGYLKHVIEDTAPVLGGKLNANNKTLDNLWLLQALTAMVFKVNDESILSLSGSSAKFWFTLDMNNTKITSLGTPTADADAATKKYVDDNAGGVSGFSDVSGSRSANTVYQNTSGKTRYCLISLYVVEESIAAFIGAANPPTMTLPITITTGAMYQMITLIVPNNWYYKVTAPSGIGEWLEST
ncbi:MAG: hypothetical protein WC329_02020 [Candidatus Omnitrophota bacterium]